MESSTISLKRKVKESSSASSDAPLQIEKKAKRAKKAPTAIAATEEIADNDASATGVAPVSIEKKTKKKAKKAPAAVTASEEIADTVVTDAAAVEECAGCIITWSQIQFNNEDHSNKTPIQTLRGL